MGHSLGACASCWGECLYLPQSGGVGQGVEGVCVLTSKLQAGPASKGASGWGITLTGSQCCRARGPCDQGMSAE